MHSRLFLFSLLPVAFAAPRPGVYGDPDTTSIKPYGNGHTTSTSTHRHTVTNGVIHCAVRDGASCPKEQKCIPTKACYGSDCSGTCSKLPSVPPTPRPDHPPPGPKVCGRYGPKCEPGYSCKISPGHNTGACVKLNKPTYTPNDPRPSSSKKPVYGNDPTTASVNAYTKAVYGGQPASSAGGDSSLHCGNGYAPCAVGYVCEKQQNQQVGNCVKKPTDPTPTYTTSTSNTPSAPQQCGNGFPSCAAGYACMTKPGQYVGTCVTKPVVDPKPTTTQPTNPKPTYTTTSAPTGSQQCGNGLQACAAGYICATKPGQYTGTCVKTSTPAPTYTTTSTPNTQVTSPQCGSGLPSCAAGYVCTTKSGQYVGTCVTEPVVDPKSTTTKPTANPKPTYATSNTPTSPQQCGNSLPACASGYTCTRKPGQYVGTCIKTPTDPKPTYTSITSTTPSTTQCGKGYPSCASGYFCSINPGQYVGTCIKTAPTSSKPIDPKPTYSANEPNSSSSPIVQCGAGHASCKSGYTCQIAPGQYSGTCVRTGTTSSSSGKPVANHHPTYTTKAPNNPSVTPQQCGSGHPPCSPGYTCSKAAGAYIGTCTKMPTDPKPTYTSQPTTRSYSPCNPAYPRCGAGETCLMNPNVPSTGACVNLSAAKKCKTSLGGSGMCAAGEMCFWNPKNMRDCGYCVRV